MLALAEYNAHPYDVDASKIVFKDVKLMWMEKGLSDIKEGTARNYTSNLKHLEALDRYRIRDIKTAHLQTFFDGLDSAGISVIIQKKVKALLHRILVFAMQNDYIEKDYSQFVKIRKDDSKESIHAAFTAQEIQTLWNNLDLICTQTYRNTYKLVDTILMTIYMGLRPQELLSITKDDVNIEGHYIVGGIKTEAGRDRIIPIHDDIYDMVKARYESSSEYLIEFNGKPITYYVYRKKYADIMEKLAMHHLPHDGRHTFASFGKMSGLDPYYVSKVMGHKIDSITEAVYTHVTPETLVDQVNRIQFI